MKIDRTELRDKLVKLQLLVDKDELTVQEQHERKQLDVWVTEQYPQIFKELVEPLFMHITFAEEPFDRWASVSMDNNCKPPLIKNESVTEEYLDSLTKKTAKAHQTVSGVMEELISLKCDVDNNFNRAFDMFKAITNFSNAGRTKVLFEVTLPEKVHQYRSEVAKYEAIFTERLKALDKTRTSVRQLIDLYTKQQITTGNMPGKPQTAMTPTTKSRFNKQ